MISSESINKLFNALAKFIGRITGRKLQFHQVGGEPMGIACEKMNRFFEDASEVLNEPTVQMMGVLEPGKIYVLQIDDGVDIEVVCEIADELLKENIRIVLINKDMNFVQVPKGYEITMK